ncbi:MAG: phosphohydrolase [Mucilaginibacter sp.]|nr:phosphohydrolase [Mucilaginibacter sp.]
MSISILKPESIVNEVFALYEKYGKRKATDQELSELEQVSQAAALAEEEGYEDEVILAAFFHNAGEILGADYLREHGFSERLATLVESDLRATRYMAYKYLGYYDHLSEADKTELEARGGRMSKEEAYKFELDPDAELFVRLRYLNEKAREIRKYKLNIPHIKLLAMSHLYKIMDKYLPAFLMTKSSIQPRIG